jgi:formylglycine-generating enzyme
LVRGIRTGTPIGVSIALSSIGLSTIAVACDLGLDVDALSRGCPECSIDASIDDAGVDTSSTSDAASACPSGRGPTMDRLVLGAGSLCVDRTEVTNAQFAAFLAAGEFPPPAPGCIAGASHVPTSGWPAPPAQSAHPVVNVTWCAAHAFCTWAGKRLCGARGSGGPIDVPLIGNPAFDEWSAACSRDGAFAYPYGSTYAAKACNGDDFGERTTAPVGLLPSCASDGGPLDLSGNVWEWINACATTGCYAHGGAFNSKSSELGCEAKVAVTADAAALPTVGFRCCAP